MALSPLTLFLQMKDCIFVKRPKRRVKRFVFHLNLSIPVSLFHSLNAKEHSELCIPLLTSLVFFGQFVSYQELHC